MRQLIKRPLDRLVPTKRPSGRGKLTAWMAIAMAAVSLIGCASPEQRETQSAQPEVQKAEMAPTLPPVGADYGFTIMNATEFGLQVAETSGPGKFSLPPSSMQPMGRSNFRMVFVFGQDNQSVISYRLSLSGYLLQVTATPGWSAYPPQMSCGWTDLSGKPTSPPPNVQCAVNDARNGLTVAQTGLAAFQVSNTSNMPLTNMFGRGKLVKPLPREIQAFQDAIAARRSNEGVTFSYLMGYGQSSLFSFSINDSGPTCEFLTHTGQKLSGPPYPSCTTDSGSTPVTFTINPPTAPAKAITIDNDTGYPLRIEKYHSYTYTNLPADLPSPGRLVVAVPIDAPVSIVFTLDGNTDHFAQIVSTENRKGLICVGWFGCSVQDGPAPTVRFFKKTSGSRARHNPAPK